MDMTPREYQQYVQRKMKKSPLGKDVCLAFLVGGAICALGQVILGGWMSAPFFTPPATKTGMSRPALSRKGARAVRTSRKRSEREGGASKSCREKPRCPPASGPSKIKKSGMRP